MEMKYKRVIFSKAKKERECWLCKHKWKIDEDIGILKDLEKDSFELICYSCGKDLTEIGSKQRSKRCVDDLKSYIDTLPDSDNKAILLECFKQTINLLKLCEEGGGND